MKILVSGSTGFIGKRLVKRLTDDGHIVRTIVRPCPKIDALISFMQKEKFDGVIHLASLYLARHKPGDIENLVDSNILLGTKLLEASVKSQTPWFINTSSAVAQHYKNKDYSPINLYAAAKQAFEDIAKYYIQISDINFVTLELFETFGPKDTRPKIFNLLSKASKTGETINLSPEKKILDINYIDNVTDAYAHVVELLSKNNGKSLCGKKFMVSSNQRLTLRELVSVFERTTKTKLNVNWSNKKYNFLEIMSPWKKGKKIPGWKAKISLEDGLRMCLKD